MVHPLFVEVYQTLYHNQSVTTLSKEGEHGLRFYKLLKNPLVKYEIKLIMIFLIKHSDLIEDTYFGGMVFVPITKQLYVFGGNSLSYSQHLSGTIKIEVFFCTMILTFKLTVQAHDLILKDCVS